MFKIESYVAPILLSYVDKYVRDFKRVDAQVSLWTGGVALHNLVLKADVLQQELALPFTLVSGRIHELLIQVPWTKIMSDPIIVTIDTIECVLSLDPPPPEETPQPETPSRRVPIVETPPGYMQALVRRVVSNISLRIHHLIVKYVQDDIVMSLNVKHLNIDSAGPDWKPAFADIDQHMPVVRRLVRLDDLTLCLDKSDADGKIRYYQEPLLYRCQLELRVLTKLVSVNSRRASSLSIQLRSSKLAWSITSDQLVLLLRLIRELGNQKTKTPQTAPNVSNINQASLHTSSLNTTEATRSGSWTEWAWSWMPTWIDREEGAEEASSSSTGSTPISFSAHFDEVSLVFKVMESDVNNRKRPRGVLEIITSHAAIKSYFSSPITKSVKLGLRTLILRSHGKCVCGHTDYNAIQEEPTVYLCNINTVESDQEWKWPEENFAQEVIETPNVAQDDDLHEQDPGRQTPDSSESEQSDLDQPMPSHTKKGSPHVHSEFWRKLAPVVSFDYIHERSPPMHYVDPYDNPPKDFQHSDWVENCSLKINIGAMELNVCMGLLHRLAALNNIYKELPYVPAQELPMRVLTVEECEALYDNLPQRRMIVDARDLHVRIIPWDHSLTEKPSPPPLILDIHLPKTIFSLNMPLYPHRVCSAACQLPDDNDPVWQGARLHVTASVHGAQAGLCTLTEPQPKLCARADLRVVTHRLLNDYLFVKSESIIYNYSIKIREINLFGSAARLRASWEILNSLIKCKKSQPLVYTVLANDAINDEDAVAIDMSFEDISFRSFLTKNVNTYFVTMHSARATLHHELKEKMKQAWIFSAPDIPSTAPYVKVIVQWSWEPMITTQDHVGVWVQATAFSVDPLLVAWLAYTPQMKPIDFQNQPGSSKTVSSTQNFTRYSTQSSSSRGVVRSSSSAELIHGCTRSAGSSSEPSEKKHKKVVQPMTATQTTSQTLLEEWWVGEKPKLLYERLRNTIVNIDVGIVLVYYTTSSASATDSVTLRDAMERHAFNSDRVLAVSLGRMNLQSSPLLRLVWNEVRQDGPTFISQRLLPLLGEPDSFPWKLTITDVSCYTLEVRADEGRRERSLSGLRSQLKVPCVVTPRSILALVSTTITMALITKTLSSPPVPTVPTTPNERSKTPDETQEQTKMQVFDNGMQFKPNTMKDFFRGPARRSKSPNEEQNTENAETKQLPPIASSVTIGLNIYAETAPIFIRLCQDQVGLVATAGHCVQHLVSLLQRAPSTVTRPETTVASSQKLLTRSVSEMEEIHDVSDNTSASEIRSELISIYEAHSAREAKMKVKTSFWFQWVLGRVSLMVSSPKDRFAFEVDDIITTIDLHRHYSQIKTKVASTAVKHFERNGSSGWTTTALGGRVLEVREPTNAQEENDFLIVTITQAELSHIPASWKCQLHPKLLEKRNDTDSMWEFYVTLSPLEMVLQPKVIEYGLSLLRDISPRSSCSLLETRLQSRQNIKPRPFLFLNSGGLRLLVTCKKEEHHRNDTIILEIGEISGNPHPENPLCRSPVISPAHPHWTGNRTAHEGQQYELKVQRIELRTAQFRQIVLQENREAEIREGTAGENPALKWSLPDLSPVLTPVLHPLDLIYVFGPTVYVSGTVLCGPIMELNLTSDCVIEVSLQHFDLLRRFFDDITATFSTGRGSEISINDEKDVCPYSTLLNKDDSINSEIPPNDNPFTEDTSKDHPDMVSSMDDVTTENSAFSAFKSTKTFEDLPFTAHNSTKKSVSIAVTEKPREPIEYLEVFVTLAVVDISLYTVDDNSPEVTALRPPITDMPTYTDSTAEVLTEDSEEPLRPDDMETHASNRSISESARIADMGQAKLEAQIPQERRNVNNLPLLHLTIHQPYVYYCRKKQERTFQVTIFNIWMGHGLGEVDGFWNSPLITTTRGAADPVTDIPPVLFTMKVALPPIPTHGSSSNIIHKGNISIDLDRPIMFEVSADNILRLKWIYKLILKKVCPVSNDAVLTVSENSMIYTVKKYLENHGFETITMKTSQIGICGSEGTIGCDELKLQVAIGSRPDRLVIFSSMIALVISAGPSGDRRHVFMLPLVLGCSVDATWETWRRMEGGITARQPSLLVTIEMDTVTIDPRPEDLAAAYSIQEAIAEVLADERSVNSVESLCQEDVMTNARQPLSNVTEVLSEASNDTFSSDNGDHYYKDDLRSGTFNMVCGGQLPVAYQVTLYGNCVTWKYPHPRAITRIVLLPLPGQNEETECILEFYDPLLCKWETHSYFNLPVIESRETQLDINPPETVFAFMWRFRANYETYLVEPPYQFVMAKFLPHIEPLKLNTPPSAPDGSPYDECVTAEQLAGILRVDSYFAPRQVPGIKLVVRLTQLEINFHNSLPNLSSQATVLEGYYVSRPLMRSHRVLRVTAFENVVRAQSGSSAGALLLLATRVSSDILDCTTGAMELFVDKVRTHVALSFPENKMSRARGRVCIKKMRIAIYVPRLRTLHSLAMDWQAVIDQCFHTSSSMDEFNPVIESTMSKRDLAAVTATVLEGRISLWIHNSTASALRIGQDGTDEVVPLSSGSRIAYRWQNPTAVRRLRFALAAPSTTWHWSRSIPFIGGLTRVRVESFQNIEEDKTPIGSGMFVHAKVIDNGAQRNLHLSGRLVLANMLQLDLIYKVRARYDESEQWETVATGHLPSETIGRSVLCDANCHLVLKLRFLTCDNGWSGDIPIRESPNQDVPWLVKVPLSEDIPYTSMWCRVARAQADGRLLAAMWPLYIMQSHLAIDTNLLVYTEAGLSYLDLTDSEVTAEPKPQSVEGCGATTYLKVPGTTSARHQMTLKYKNTSNFVTFEPVPLHYSVTETTVFEKQSPVHDIDDLLNEIIEWFNKYGRNAKRTWPYSIVTSHYDGIWLAATQQPKTEIVVRYQAVRRGGGCCINVQVCPLVLVCNAAPILLIIRAHDASPLFRLDTGDVIAPPTNFIKKPFYISVEIGRETFVSSRFVVLNQEPSPYAKPALGQITVDRPVEFVIKCNQKVALFNLYYEIKEEMNIIGLDVTYMLLNRLDTDLLVSPIVVPKNKEETTFTHVTSFKIAEPIGRNSLQGTPLYRFSMREKWCGNNPSELNVYICLALPSGSYPAWTSVPVQIGNGPVRRSFALVDINKKSVPVVVTQFKHDGRWLVSVSKDPCPQYIVHNRSKVSLAIAEPSHLPDEPSTSTVKPKQECAGARWSCFVQPNMALHYSSPSYFARYPVSQNTPKSNYVPYIIIAKYKEEGVMDWCQPVAVSNVEQLVQLRGGVTIKMRISVYPHSSHIEFQEVEYGDISASDIRRRLHGVLSNAPMKSIEDNFTDESADYNLERTGANSQLFSRSSLNIDTRNIRSPPASEINILPSFSPIIPSDMVTFPPPAIPGPSHRIPYVPLSNDQYAYYNDSSRPGSHLAGIYYETQTLKQSNNDVEEEEEQMENNDNDNREAASPELSYVFDECSNQDWNEDGTMPVQSDRFRLLMVGVTVEMSSTIDTPPLMAVHLDRIATAVYFEPKKTKAVVSVGHIQIDNMHYNTFLYDFAVLANTGNLSPARDNWPSLWTMIEKRDFFAIRKSQSKLLLSLQYDNWRVLDNNYRELTEIFVHAGPAFLYVEDAYMKAIADLFKMAYPQSHGSEVEVALAEESSLINPLRLRTLHINPLNLTLTLHTAVRMYIALDQSPLRLNAFKIHDMITSPDSLMHMLTVHYLSAAILGAGWVVGGLELLGAPGALAARVSNATGGIRGVAFTTFAAVVRSVSCWAGSLARNLDLLAGDEEHAKRAAAARRRPPETFGAGIMTGLTNFAINILGAVGGLAHHPFVGVAVGESESSATALRRGLVGALTKPLSATADLVAFAGQGLLRQTGWDDDPECRLTRWSHDRPAHCWQRDCVRWAFRLTELSPITAFEVLLDNASLQLIITHRLLIIADTETERIIEMINLRHCSLAPYEGTTIKLKVVKRRASRVADIIIVDEDAEFQVSAAAMARVARYIDSTSNAFSGEYRTLYLVPPPGRAYTLQAALVSALRQNADSHLPLL